MRRQLLLAIARFVYRRPWWMATLLLLFTAESTYYARELFKQIDYDWTSFLSEEMPSVRVRRWSMRHTISPN